MVCGVTHDPRVTVRYSRQSGGGGWCQDDIIGSQSRNWVWVRLSERAPGGRAVRAVWTKWKAEKQNKEEDLGDDSAKNTCCVSIRT